MKQLNILVLDDMAIRHVGFRAKWPEHNVVSCLTIWEFQTEISKGNWDVVCFDHDLNDESSSVEFGQYGNKELTGVDAAWFLVNQVPKDKWPEMCLIHSVNQRGANNIATVLSDAGIQHKVIPFTSLDKIQLKG